MKVFHHDSYGFEDVDAANAIERPIEEVLRIFAGVTEEGSFIGIELDTETVLQLLCYEEGMLRTEILNKRARTIDFCILNTPLAEEAIREAFRGGDIRAVPRVASIQWHHETL